jgi:copper chaperone CopZ
MNRFTTQSASIMFAAFAAFVMTTAQSATLVATVNGMVCAFCAAGIEKKMRAQDATQDVYVNLEKKVVAVQFKDGKQLDDTQFRSIITDAGYEVRDTKRMDQTAAQIKAEMKAKP